MTKERELLRRAFHVLETHCGEGLELKNEIRTYLSTPSDDAEEPKPSRIEVIYGVIRDCREKKISDLEIARQVVLLYGPPPNDAAEPEAEPVAWTNQDELDCLGNEVTCYMYAKPEFTEGDIPLYLHPPKPAESEAEPMSWPIDREWLRSVLRFAEKNPDYFYDVEPGFVSLDGGDTDAVIAALNKPAEQEAETIETLQAENFKLASGQCTEGGPWGDEGGTPCCKYAKRKPMTEEEIDKAIGGIGNLCVFKAGIRYAEKHHLIGGADE